MRLYIEFLSLTLSPAANPACCDNRSFQIMVRMHLAFTMPNYCIMLVAAYRAERHPCINSSDGRDISSIISPSTIYRDSYRYSDLNEIEWNNPVL